MGASPKPAAEDKQRLGELLAEFYSVFEGQRPFASVSVRSKPRKDLRMSKLRRKISGGFRSAPGARDCAPLRSVLATARQQGLNRIEALRLGPDALLARLLGTPAPGSSPQTGRWAYLGSYRESRRNKLLSQAQAIPA